MKSMKHVLLLTVMTMVVFTSACGKSNDTSGSDAANEPAAGSNNSANAAEETIDINAKYDPAITVTAIRDQDPSMAFKEGDDFENNNWTKAYADELGITLKYDWIAPSDQYYEKLNVAIASGDIPDIMKVNGAQLKQLVDADLIADLTDVYNKYASELTKKSIEMGPLAKASATFDGKLMAIPPDEGSFEGGVSLMYIRADWLKKLNLEAPKTWAELEKVMDAFVNQDPDGNGKKDTFGMGLTKDLYKNGVAEATGVFNAFGAQPYTWVTQADGTIGYGGIQPEVREALLKLQEMKNKGLIDREFGVKDSGKVGEDYANNRIGVNFGALWNPLWPLQDSVTKNADADWVVLPGISATDKPVQYTGALEFNEYMVVSKKMEHPEALIKLLNISQEKLYGGKADPKVFHTEIVGDKEYAHFKENVMMVKGSDPIGNYGHYKKVISALDSKDATPLNPEEKGYYDKIVAFQGGDRTTWGTVRVFGTESAYSVLDGIYQNKEQNINFTKFYGSKTKTMAEKMATLDKMQKEVFTKIILGSPIEEFDKFVADWKKLGGDQITQEVAEWAAQQSK
ncbi:extracellular solute-binding protein [Paenibacillus sp. CF384]|uniref:extracellular solute-binding protein n=1 Tax=Paenibacillus sp. CF384 TaxID=1884382 RepID=UPI000895F497|nr:extracellular solute-binding protein [Paenibacillus sp. CF384]SDX57860.1 putative aldouronate transport system substrate-binding protein [Paenibacillus sp. CF384]